MRYIGSIFLFFTLVLTALCEESNFDSSSDGVMIERLQNNRVSDWILKAEAIQYCGQNKVLKAIPVLKSILENKKSQPWIRGRALMSLARIQPDNLPDLTKTYAKDSSHEVRAVVAELCAGLPIKIALPIINSYLLDRQIVIFNALASLAHHEGETTWKIAKPKFAKVPSNCIEPAARCLGRLGNTEAIKRLLELANEGHSKDALIRGLKGLKTPSLPSFFIELMALTKSPLSIADAWQELQNFKNMDVINACQKILASGSEQKIQIIANLMISNLKEVELAQSLKLALQKTKNTNTIKIGLASLSCINADLFKEFFITYLNHAKAELRLVAIRCLAECSEINLYETLEKSLNDPDSKVRVAALVSLTKPNSEHSPKNGVLKYYTACLLSKDTATRKAAIAAVVPYINMDNGDKALELMQKIQNLYGILETEPLMRVTFRMIPEDKSAQILKSYGYVTNWHVIGEFPLGWGAPVEKGAKIPTVFPPEKKVDLKETLVVKYNNNSDTRFGKNIVEEKITWLDATVGNSDGVLFLYKAGRAQLQTPHKNGTSYAYTEIFISEDKEVQFEMLTNHKAGDQVWVNGTSIKRKITLNKKEGIHIKKAQIKLKSGKNTFLVKVWSNDHSGAWWAPKISTRGFSLTLRSLNNKPLKWTHK